MLLILGSGEKTRHCWKNGDKHPATMSRPGPRLLNNLDIHRLSEETHR